MSAFADPDYQPYMAGEFRWRLGLRPLDLTDWIQIGTSYLDDVATKREVLAEHPATALAWLDDVEPEAREVLDTLVDHLTAQWPQWFSADADEVRNLRTGECFDRRAMAPLELAGRLVQEDLVLLVGRDGVNVCGGGAVCFPNRWDLRSKLGLPLPAVHTPVAQLNEQLGDSIARFFDRLTPDKSYWRLGWSVLDSDRHYQAVDGTAPPSPPLPSATDADALASAVHLRVERETFRRFPRTGCVLFTLRTYLRPLSHLDGRPGDARRLSEALHRMPADVVAYKALEQLGPLAAQWLERVATSGELDTI